MEHFSGQQLESVKDEDGRPRTVERLSNWVTGMQAELGQKRSPETAPDSDTRKELDFEKTKEAPKLPDAVLKGSMIAVGEVLTDKLSQQRPPHQLIGAAGVKAAKRRNLQQQEQRATTQVTPAKAAVLTMKQAIQLGVLVGVCLGLLVLVWMAAK